MNRLQNNRRGAISTEYIIILVLIAVGGIIAFMLLGTTLRQQAGNSIDKIGGRSDTYDASARVDDASDRMQADVVDMTQSDTVDDEASSGVAIQEF